MYSVSKKLPLVMLLALGLVWAGCDSSVDAGGETAQVDGRVTDEEGYGKRAADVEGAAVTATSVSASGTTRSLNVSGQAQTNAQGAYSISVEDATEVIIVRATKDDDFETSTLVYTGGESSVNAMPMTLESHHESNVYVEARSGASGSAVTTADVAAYVDQSVAADIESGHTSAAEVAAAVRSASEAEFSYFEEDDEEGTEDDEEFEDEASERENNSFAQLQANLHGEATGSSAARAAVENFEEALANVYVNAGVSAETQAQARQSGAAAVRARTSVDFDGDARLNLRRRAAVLAAIATAEAIESEFESAGASNAQMSALASARTDFVSSLRAASSSSAMAEAWTAYQSDVESELETTLDVGATAIAAAKAEIAAEADSALDFAFDVLGGLADTVASAYANFYANAETAAEASLSSSNASNAAAGARVLVLLQGMASVS